jgi:hypothetical protein
MSRIRVTMPYLGQEDIVAGALASALIHTQQISLAGIVTDLLAQDQVLEATIDAARSQSNEVLGGRPVLGYGDSNESSADEGVCSS